MSLRRQFPSVTLPVPTVLSFQNHQATARSALDVSFLRRDAMNGEEEAFSASRSGDPPSDRSGILGERSLNESGPRGTVMVVDDEPAIRAMVATALANAHYQVIQALSGIDAAYRIHQLGGQIDALVTDVMMPVVSGHELAVWVRRVWPHIPVLFMSGFCETSRLQLSAHDLVHHYLAKPFKLSALITQVSLLIDERLNHAGHILHDSSCQERWIHEHTNVHARHNSFIAE